MLHFAGIFRPNSVAVARYAPSSGQKYTTNCDAHLAESLFQTRSKFMIQLLYGENPKEENRVHKYCSNRKSGKRYGNLVALDHLNLSISEGEVFGLLGPNGSGKTTAINCMLSLLKYDKGSIHIFGEEMRPDNYKVKQQIGIVLQNVAVFDELTVYENIDYFCGLYVRIRGKEKNWWKKPLPLPILTITGKCVQRSSTGGLLRRLNIACGIAHKPRLIIMDEPTVAVDPPEPEQNPGRHSEAE